MISLDGHPQHNVTILLQKKKIQLELSRFGEYLLKSRIGLERHAPFYVRWVRRFMEQATTVFADIGNKKPQ